MIIWRILGRAAWYWIFDFVTTFAVNSTPISMALCSQLVLEGVLDTGSWPSVVDDWCRFQPYNRALPQNLQIIFVATLHRTVVHKGIRGWSDWCSSWFWLDSISEHHRSQGVQWIRSCCRLCIALPSETGDCDNQYWYQVNINNITIQFIKIFYVIILNPSNWTKHWLYANKINMHIWYMYEEISQSKIISFHLK